MKRFGRTITGALSNLAAQGLPFLLLIFVTPILLRSLGREQYGALILFNLLPQIAGQLEFRDVSLRRCHDTGRHLGGRLPHTDNGDDRSGDTERRRIA